MSPESDRDFQPSMPLEDFLAEQDGPRGKRSVLDPVADQIWRALELNMSHDQIAAWLAKNGIHVSRQAVSQWVHRRQAQAERDRSNPRAAGDASPQSIKTKPSASAAEKPSTPPSSQGPVSPWDPAKKKKADASEFLTDVSKADRGNNPLMPKS
jgi:hypothetical protein